VKFGEPVDLQQDAGEDFVSVTAITSPSDPHHGFESMPVLKYKGKDSRPGAAFLCAIHPIFEE
jgi:hypothetical protein